MILADVITLFTNPPFFYTAVVYPCKQNNSGNSQNLDAGTGKGINKSTY